VEVIGRIGDVLNRGDLKGGDACSPGGDPPVAASSPDPYVREEGLQADLDMDVGVDASSLDLKATRILPEAVAATWEVHRLRGILPTTSRVPG
jgi:hypothetical protein